MKINIAKLWKEPGVKENFAFVWEDVPENMGEVSLLKPIHVKGHVSNQGNFLELLMRIKTEVMLPCSRCLDEVKLPLDLEVVDQYYSKEEWSNLSEVDEEDSSAVFFLEGDWLDLKQVVRENLLLNLPMRILCTPDCPGICPQCGRNLKEGQCNCCSADLDPRFEVLAQLKKKMES
ncbi:MAG: YceD family protein [Peptococcia bacterium]|jgi:uncharacterized protein